MGALDFTRKLSRNKLSSFLWCPKTEPFNVKTLYYYSNTELVGYNGDFNTRLVWYSNFQKLFDRQMVWYLNTRYLNIGQVNVCHSDIFVI